MNVNGSTALVTGANRGIGKAFVQELLDRGAAKVYAGARDLTAIDVHDERLVPVPLDVTSDEAVAALAEKLTDVDLIINNAGIGRPGLPLTATLDHAREQFEVNVLGTVRTTQSFAPTLAANGGGAIVNVLSIVSWNASPFLSTYSASKAAAWSYTNSSRVELGLNGTQVVGVHVGFVDTDLTAGMDGDKVAPQTVAASALDALEAGKTEAIVDEASAAVRGSLSGPGDAVLPGSEASVRAAYASN